MFQMVSLTHFHNGALRTGDDKGSNCGLLQTIRFYHACKNNCDTEL